MQYNATPCRNMQYHACLITADGAYHCPVGSIWPFFHQNYSNKPNIFELDSHHLNETNFDLFVPESRISTNLPLMQTSLGTIAYDKVSAMVPFLNQKPPNLKVVIEWQKKGLKRLKKRFKTHNITYTYDIQSDLLHRNYPKLKPCHTSSFKYKKSKWPTLIRTCHVLTGRSE